MVIQDYPKIKRCSSKKFPGDGVKAKNIPARVREFMPLG